MKRFLILHGTGGNSKENWLPWLKEQLENKGAEVWVPDLPNADKPNISRYNEYIFQNKEWLFDKDTVLIGHSSGAMAILGLLQHLPENAEVDTCVLVGSFKNDLGWEALNELFIEEFDFEKIKQKAKRFIFIHSDNDPYCPLEHAEYLSGKLGGELIVKAGQGHFSASKDPSYTKFPFLLELVEKEVW